jgi:hypothetical protein
MAQYLALAPASQLRTDLLTETGYMSGLLVANANLNSVGVFYSHEVEACDYCSDNGPGFGAPWQQDFLALGLMQHLILQTTSGTTQTNITTLATQAAAFTIGRFGNGTSPNGCFSQGGMYNAEFANSQTSDYHSPPYVANFFTIWQGAVAKGWQQGGSCGNTLVGNSGADPAGPESYFANAWPSLEEAVDLGFTGASAADSLIRSATNYNSVFVPAITGDEPVWGIFHR